MFIKPFRNSYNAIGDISANFSGAALFIGGCAAAGYVISCLPNVAELGSPLARFVGDPNLYGAMPTIKYAAYTVCASPSLIFLAEAQRRVSTFATQMQATLPEKRKALGYFFGAAAMEITNGLARSLGAITIVQDIASGDPGWKTLLGVGELAFGKLMHILAPVPVRSGLRALRWDLSDGITTNRLGR